MPQQFVSQETKKQSFLSSRLIYELSSLKSKYLISKFIIVMREKNRISFYDSLNLSIHYLVFVALVHVRFRERATSLG